MKNGAERFYGFAQVCSKYANRVIGIDPSEDMLTKAKEKEYNNLLEEVFKDDFQKAIFSYKMKIGIK